jgi:four helix bundle protein
LSISLNIVEEAGKYAIDEKIRFYRMAKRSASKCTGILDVCQKLQLLNEQKYDKDRDMIVKMVSILVKMALAEKLIVKRRAGIQVRC